MSKRWKIICAFCAVFIAGGLAGGLLGERRAAQKYEHIIKRHERSRSLDRFTPGVLRRYSQRLELSEEQRAQVEPIVRETEAKLRQLSEGNLQATIALGDQMNTQIASLLSAEQLEELERIKIDVRKYWERERERRGLKGERRNHKPHS